MRRAALSLTRQHKYGAKKTVVDNITFASKKEARRYQELRLLEKAGEISDLRLQEKFQLNVCQRGFCGAFLPVGTYVADFSYWDRRGNGSSVYEDVKGFKTPLYRWKKKHVEAQYGIQIREV